MQFTSSLRRQSTHGSTARLPKQPSPRQSPLTGCVILFVLIAASFFTGGLFPVVLRAKPIPTSRRTICKEKPFEFDKAKAKGVKVLITGAATFLGSHVARYCAEELQMEVVGIDDLVQGGESLQYSGDISIVNGDITDVAFLQKIFGRYSFDIIYHLADFSGTTMSHSVPSYTYRSNIAGSVNLITEAVKANVTKFVLQSAAAVYGHALLPWAESTHPKPAEPYGISKLAVEQHLKYTSTYFGLDYVILRMHNLYGPRQDNMHSNLLSRAIAAAMTGGSVTVMGDGTQKRQFTFVEDVVPTVVAAGFLEPSRRVMNLGSDEIVTVNEVLTALSEITGKPLNITFEEQSRGHIHHVQAVHDRSQCLMQLPKFTDFATGLKKTMEWALSTTNDVRKADKYAQPSELQTVQVSDAQLDSEKLRSAPLTTERDLGLST